MGFRNLAGVKEMINRRCADNARQSLWGLLTRQYVDSSGPAYWCLWNIYIYIYGFWLGPFWRIASLILPRRQAPQKALLQLLHWCPPMPPSSWQTGNFYILHITQMFSMNNLYSIVFSCNGAAETESCTGMGGVCHTLTDGYFSLRWAFYSLWPWLRPRLIRPRFSTRHRRVSHPDRWILLTALRFTLPSPRLRLGVWPTRRLRPRPRPRPRLRLRLRDLDVETWT